MRVITYLEAVGSGSNLPGSFGFRKSSNEAQHARIPAESTDAARRVEHHSHVGAQRTQFRQTCQSRPTSRSYNHAVSVSRKFSKNRGIAGGGGGIKGWRSGENADSEKSTCEYMTQQRLQAKLKAKCHTNGTMTSLTSTEQRQRQRESVNLEGPVFHCTVESDNEVGGSGNALQML